MRRLVALPLALAHSFALVGFAVRAVQRSRRFDRRAQPLPRVRVGPEGIGARAFAIARAAIRCEGCTASIPARMTSLT